MSNPFNKKKIIGDAIFSIAASAIPIVSLQLILLPLVAQHLPSGDEYGLVIALVGVMAVIAATFDPLNNVRLIMEGVYNERGANGDFNILLTVCMALGAVATLISASLYQVDIIHLFLLSVATMLCVANSYLGVGFRLALDYKCIFVSNFIQGIGYFAGFGLFLLYGYWELIYLTGYVTSVVYIISKTKLLKEPFRITPLMRITFYKALVVLVAACLGSMTVYIDRFILFPIIGGTALSIYYASTILGKAISLAITPIAGVMLSYFSQMKQISRNGITSIILLSTAAGAIGYVICIFISPYLLKLMYPQWAAEAMNLIYITTLTAVVNMICSTISPVILRFRSINWQIAIHMGTLIIYLIAGLILLKAYGLMGFCVGALITGVFKLAIMVLICYVLQGESQMKESVV